MKICEVLAKYESVKPTCLKILSWNSDAMFTYPIDCPKDIKELTAINYCLVEDYLLVVVKSMTIDDFQKFLHPENW